jgi:hypothetical protein
MPNLVRVRFARISQFDLVADAYRCGAAQLIDLVVPQPLHQITVAFLLGLSSGSGGDLERQPDGTYLLTPAGWDPAEEDLGALDIAA